MISLRNYDSASNCYEIPNDGYIVVGTSTSNMSVFTNMYSVDRNNTPILLARVDYTHKTSIYVRKGMKVYFTYAEGSTATIVADYLILV